MIVLNAYAACYAAKTWLIFMEHMIGSCRVFEKNSAIFLSHVCFHNGGLG